MSNQSDPQTPSFEPPPPPPPPKQGTRKALLVAVNYTGTNDTLGTVPTSALTAMQNKIINGGYFNAEDVSILTDQTDKRDVSISNVRKALKQLVSGAKESDVLYFYFFGHGSSTNTRSGSRRESIMLFKDDGNGTANFYDVDLAAIIDDIPAKSNLTMTFNSCHSEGMADYVPYAPKRGITLAAVPYNLPTFFSGIFAVSQPQARALHQRQAESDL